MGRGGGQGGSSGGGSRGFSSHRSSTGSAGRGRGGGRPSPTPKPSSPRPSPPRERHSAPPPRRYAPPPRRYAPPPPPRRYAPPRRYYGHSGGYGYGGRQRSSGCCIGPLAVIAIIVIVVVVISAAPKINDFTKGLNSDAYTAENNAIQQNQEQNNGQETTAPREKLDADACIRTDQLILDQLGWLSDTDAVKNAMDYFYDQTGVQPYLIICDNLDGKGGEITDEEAERILETSYNDLYADEGHLIFAFMEYATSEYITFLYTGSSADTVIDTDAREIFLNNADRFYTDSSLSDDEYFAKIFRDSADRIMNP